MISKTKFVMTRGYVLNTSTRLCSKTSKKVDKREPIASQDVVNYLESDPEYKDIINILPKSLLKKYKSPETMYLINKKTASDITNTIMDHIETEAPLVEVNPGFGFLTKELLRLRSKQIYLYETSNFFNQFLDEIQQKHPDQVKFKIANFFGMWNLAFQDKMDQGNRIKELLGDLATDDNDRILNIVGAMSSLSFVKRLMNNVIFLNTSNQLGRPVLYFAMPGHHYEFLADATIQSGKYKSMPSLFQLIFDYKVLGKVPKVHFLPWTHTPNGTKLSIMDDYCLYLVKIMQKSKLPCPPSYLPLLWYFFKRNTFTKTTKVIPMLEQWIPGCGVWLITGQDPPETNTQLSPTEDDAKLPHMTIFTEFGDLNLKQRVTIFKRFISWPEFDQCPFRVTMENNLPKFASQIDDDDDDRKRSVTLIDDIDTSDTEADADDLK